MLLNYLKLSLRLLARNPFFTFINVAGLSVGFAVFFILWPFTQSELKSDQFIPDHERIERVVLDFRWTDNGGESWGHLNIPGVWSFITAELQHASILDATRYASQDWFFTEMTPNLRPELVVAREKNGREVSVNHIEKSICADKNFFQFFGLPMLYGAPENALKDANGVAISARAAVALFGDGNPLGEQLKINEHLFVVSGVFKDIPKNSHFEFDYVFSNEGKLSAWNAHRDEWWGTKQYYKLNDHGETLPVILNQNKEKLIGAFLQKNQHIKVDFTSQPLDEVAFHEYNGDYFKPKSKFMLNTLAGVSVIVLIMAWLNYVNLTVSRTKTRFKEIAARKVSGAVTRNLFAQFMCESAVINVLAVLVGITLVQIVRQPFDLFLHMRVVSLFDVEWQTLAFFAGIFVVGIIGTSAYPAWVTMRHSTRQLLNLKVISRKRITTTLFTTVQYSAALTLVAWVFVMNDQLTFIMTKALGLDKESVVVVNAPVVGLGENGLQRINQFASLIKSQVGDDRVSMSHRVCGEHPWAIELRQVGADVFYGIDTQGVVDENFIPLYGLKLIAGRNFVKDEKKKAVIISRFAAERLGFKSPEEAVGSMIEAGYEEQRQPAEIIGVIEDYRVTPFIMAGGSTESVTGRGQCLTYQNALWDEAVPQRISLKTNGDDALRLIAEVETLFKQQFPGNLFNWYFLDDNVNKQYGDQEIARNQLTFFTILAVAVACLGLLGMVSNKVSEKFKEISVRRILGASNQHVLALLLRSTGVQVGVALVIGLPIAWKFSHQYLEKYTHRIDLQWWHFTVPVLMLLLIMMVTIAGILWKATRSNPVEALKHE